MVTYEQLLGLPGAHQNGRPNGVGITCPNPDCEHPEKAFAHIVAGQVRFGCGGCFQSLKVTAAFAPYLNGAATTPVLRRPSLRDWQEQLLALGHRVLTQDPEYRDKPMPAEHVLEPLIEDMRFGVNAMVANNHPPPAELTEADISEEVEKAARLSIEVWAGRLIWSRAAVPPTVETETTLLTCETADQAVVSNDEYLSRAAIIGQLFYECAASLGVGGKHEGKTVNVRTEALAVAAGEPVYDRPTLQMPVIYAASDDEYPTTRMELLHMGWQRRHLPLILVRINIIEGFEPERVLTELGRLAEKEGSRFIILDMLFDFVRVQDENKYAQTRAAVGQIQILADSIKGHVRATHHSPKWMPDAATAAKAALGSQGIVAKFSPILLSRKWAEELYTIESTMTRDPRGLALKPSVVIRREDGWAEVTGEFKAWMKWRMYTERVKGLFEGGEPGRKMSVSQVMEALEVSRQETQNTLYQMSLPDPDGNPGVLMREKFGKKYLYKLTLSDNSLFSGGSR